MADPSQRAPLPTAEQPQLPLPETVLEATCTFRPTGAGGPAEAPAPQETAFRDFGDYRLLRPIARGGMGAVYLARQCKLNRIVALKMIRAGALASDAEVRRFRAEAEAAAQLDHPGIVPVFEVGEHDGQHYFSMGYVEGGSLAAKVRDGPLPAQEAAVLVWQIAEAVAYAHQRGVIHRDLKPANVLLGPDGRPRVTDFGLAKQVQRDSGLTQAGQVMGTPSYMPPEQAAGKGEQVGPAADIYSLGGILYCLLTGRPPFQAASVMETLQQVLEQEPVPPRQLNAGVPRDLETVCLKCLAKEPNRRYAGAAALAEELRRFLAGEPIQARPTGRLERAVKWARRRPALAALTVGLPLSLLVGTAVSWYFAAAAHQEAQAAVEAKGRAENAAEDSRQAQQLAEEEKKIARRRFYTSQVNVAHYAWRDSQTALMLDLLAGLEPGPADSDDPRGFEWHYLTRLAHRDRFTLSGHADLVFSVAYSPDGKLLATGSSDNTVRLWDPTTGKAGRVLPTARGHFGGLVFSPDSTRLAGAAFQGKPGITVWEVETGKELVVGSTGWCGVAWSPDGNLLAVSAGKEGKISLLDPSTGNQTGELVDASYRPSIGPYSSRGLSLSPDGKLLAVAVRHRQFMTPQDPRIPPAVQVWDVAGRKVLVTLEGNKGYEDIGSVAFSRDGRLFATGGNDRTVRLYDVATWRELRTLRGHTGDVTSLSFSPDGKLLAAVNFSWPDAGHKQRIVKLWDPATGEERGNLRGHTAAVTDVAFSPDGTRLATASWDCTAKVWEVTAAQDADSLYHGPARVGAVAASGSGRYLAWALLDRGPSGFITLFDFPSRRTFRQIEFKAVDLALSRDGRWLAARGADRSEVSRNEVRVWDTESGTPRLNLGAANVGKGNLAFSPDGTRLAVGKERDIRVWDVPGGQLAFTLPGEKDPVKTLSFSPDGRWLASGHGPRVSLWDFHKQTVQHTFSLPAQGTIALAFSPDSRRLACADLTQAPATADVTSRIHVWDLSSFEELLTLAGHTQLVSGLAFSPDGERLATASLDRTVKVWDSRVGQQMLTLEGHEGGVLSAFFTPDGHYLITADGVIPNTRAPPVGWPSPTRYSVKLWDARPWKE